MDWQEWIRVIGFCKVLLRRIGVAGWLVVGGGLGDFCWREWKVY